MPDLGKTSEACEERTRNREVGSALCLWELQDHWFRRQRIEVGNKKKKEWHPGKRDFGVNTGHLWVLCSLSLWDSCWGWGAGHWDQWGVAVGGNGRVQVRPWSKGQMDTITEEGEFGTSLVIQWVRLCATNAGGPGSIPGQGTRSRTWQQRSRVPQLRPGAAK